MTPGCPGASASGRPRAPAPDPSDDLRPPIWSDRAARFHARAMDRSDYGPTAAAALRDALGVPASLLDIGAGAGHPVLLWLPPDAPWFAVEPNRFLRAHLGRLSRTTHPGLHPLDALWRDLPALDLPPVAVALAANIGGPLEAPRDLLRLMRAAATRQIAWIVPAQRGPKRWCLSGALPASLHGEDETPAVARILAALGPDDAPDRMAAFAWTFTARFVDAAAAHAHCAAQLALAPDDPRHAPLAAHLARALTPTPDGALELAAPKRSAILVWNAR